MTNSSIPKHVNLTLELIRQSNEAVLWNFWEIVKCWFFGAVKFSTKMDPKVNKINSRHELSKIIVFINSQA